MNPETRLAFCILVPGMVLSCSAPAMPPTATSDHQVLPSSGGKRGAPPSFCVEGCLGTDPDPAAVGYWLAGAENQWEHCADPDNDQDHDGLDDECEYTLALSFRPEMSFGPGDDVRREPRWAAEWLGGEAETRTVRIAYLPSYWMDMGDGGASHSNCETFSLFPVPGFLMSLETCGGHAGDSEWIRLDIRYNATSQHWYVAGALYSAHEWHVDFQLLTDSTLRSVPESWPSYAADVEYIDKRGGYPRAYVADRKHANYPTRQFCNDHGGVDQGVNSASDSCTLPRTLERLEVSMAQNIGSRAYPFINCVATQRLDHPSYGGGKQECYWSSWANFAGWFNTSGGGGSADPYGIHLYNYFGF